MRRWFVAASVATTITTAVASTASTITDGTTASPCTRDAGSSRHARRTASGAP